MNLEKLDGHIGIGHTRWATFGKVTDKNAHPFASDNVTIVHNGIIRNFDRIALEKKGFVFTSETDSEFIVHYFSDKIQSSLQKTSDVDKNALREICIKTCKTFFEDIDGEFATLIMVKELDEIYALKRGSPLALTKTKIGCMVASDISAFDDRLFGASKNLAKDIVFLEDDEFAIIGSDSYSVFSKDGNKVEKRIERINWEISMDKGEYEYHMKKEIDEQPDSVRRLMLSLDTLQKSKIDELIDLCSKKKVIFTGSGTSYFATLLGVYFLHKAGIPAQTIIASEFENFVGVDDKTLVIALSQSGETMDVIDAIKHAKQKGAKIASLVNVPYSTIQRLSDLSLDICAGQEIAVASTKAFTNQTALLLHFAGKVSGKDFISGLPKEIEDVLKLSNNIKNISKRLAEKNDIYILGQGLTYPTAREIALKLKEVSYVHAEGMMGGELKHGTIALIESGTPVISLVGKGERSDNADEVRARGADVIMISTSKDADIRIDTSNGKFAILSAIVGQLMAYYVAKERNLPIDKPRNLAKSVTVR